MPVAKSILQEYDFDQSVGYWIMLAAQAYQKALNNELAPHGITFRQSQVLGWLALEGPLSQAELAGRMMIEPPTLVGVLDRMERDNLIRRVASPTDRRCKLVCVHPAAADVWHKVIQCARRVRARAVDGLSPQQSQRLMKALQSVIQNLNSSNATDAGSRREPPDGSRIESYIGLIVVGAALGAWGTTGEHSEAPRWSKSAAGR